MGWLQKNKTTLSEKFDQISRRLRDPHFWRSGKNWFKRPSDELTLVLLSKGHLEVRKVRLSPKALWFLKVGLAFAVFIFICSSVFLVNFLAKLPETTMMKAENDSLRRELSKIQFHLDTLQVGIDRMNRFDQKLRALTDVDKEFAKMRGPGGQGGGDEDIEPGVYDFGGYKVEGANLEIDDSSSRFVDREERFLIQKIYSWMKQLFKNSELQEQSLEELFEVLKGREIQLSATPAILPVSGWVTSHFGYRLDPFTGRRAQHKGIDVVAREGAPIVSPADGVVTFVGPYGSYGNSVMIFHGYGISTLYAHTSESTVYVGQNIKRGDVIAKVGTTGRSTAPHLHYEVVVHGVAVDPRKYILNKSL